MKQFKVYGGILMVLGLMLFVSHALARMADPSRQPKLDPLRPPAQNVQPNYQNSVNAVSPTSSEFDLLTGEVVPPKEALAEEAEKQSAAKPLPVLKRIIKPVVWLPILLIVAGGVFVGYFIFYYRKKE